MDDLDSLSLEGKVMDALRLCYDPEIPINIVEVGLIYSVVADNAGKVDIQMTLTSPNCPAAQSLPADVENAAKSIIGVKDVKIDLTFDPPWTPARMSDAARLQLGMF